MSHVAQTLLFIVCGSSAVGAMFLGNVLGVFPVIDENAIQDASDSRRSVLRFFPNINININSNRVTDEFDSLD